MKKNKTIIFQHFIGIRRWFQYRTMYLNHLYSSRAFAQHWSQPKHQEDRYKKKVKRKDAEKEASILAFEEYLFLLEERWAREPQPGTSVHAPVRVKQQLLKHLQHQFHLSNKNNVIRPADATGLTYSEIGDGRKEWGKRSVLQMLRNRIICSGYVHTYIHTKNEWYTSYWTIWSL